ncbi:MAG: hypothetical protein KDB10_06450 [Acidimicrobiales bacterium]|nr:hypothetical protein [Acidimicrobiales bacterium]
MRLVTHFGERSVHQIHEAVPGVEAVAVAPDGPVPEELSADALLTLAVATPTLGDLLTRGVTWVHTIGTGVDRFPLDRIGPGVTLTCSRGASAEPIAEWVLAAMLAHEKDFPDSWITAPPPSWDERSPRLGTLAGRVLGLVGFGGIARATARRALAFGMDVRCVRRSPAPVDLPGVAVADSLEALAATADHLVVAAPATAATRHLVGAGVLAAAKPGLHLVNVARGSLVDQEALRTALDDGRVARATLDTVEPEPLPEGHWLYGHPRVRLSPHISWSAPGSVATLFALALDNVDRWARGEPLLGVVDVAAGY